VIVGEESTLYVLSRESLDAEAVVYVGHPAGSVIVGAYTQSGRICFVENYVDDQQQRTSVCRFHVVSLDDQQKKWAETIQPIRMNGNVTRPLASQGNRIVVVTDLGEVRVFDVRAHSAKEPLTPVASRPATGDTRMDRFGAFVGDEFWLADNRLTRFTIQSTGGTLRAQELPDAYRGDTFTGPLSVVYSHVVHVRRPEGKAGYHVAATSSATGREIWDVELAVPVSDMTRLDGADGIGISDFNGNLFEIRNGEVAQSEYAVMSEAHVDGEAVPPHLVLIANERQVIQQRVGADTWSVHGTGENLNMVDKVALPAVLGAEAQPFSGGVLVPTQIGQVMLLDPVSGQQKAAPFQPTIDVTSLPQFSSPVVVEGANRFIIADKTRQLYLVELKDSPPRLVESAQSEAFSAPLVSPLCVAGNGAFAFNANHELVRFDVDSLELQTVFNANQSVSSGPVAAQNHVLFATGGQLYCLLSSGESAWNTTVDSRPIGVAALGESEVIVAFENGLVQQWNRISGTQKLLVDFAQPLAMGPLLAGQSLICATYDRCVVEFTIPVDPMVVNVQP